MSTNYKDTLNLPQTQFPMKADLVKREPQRLAQWEAAGLYEAIQAARADAELFVLHDGPPFANGDVHMGTALNKVLKDIIVKSRSMLGFRAPYIPGWDCHGLPIEFKVVKESRGLAPVEIRQKSEALARKFIDIQRTQFKRLGVFGDWAHPYLTLDPGYEAEIIRAFASFVEKGLVYQSKKPVYWSTGAQTALAEAEVEYRVRDEDPAIYVKFLIEKGEFAGAKMVIWTTTPWTLPANVAIALHPKAEYVVGYFKHRGSGVVERLVVAHELADRFCEALNLEREIGPGELSYGEACVGEDLRRRVPEAQHPFLPRLSRVITADFVTMDTGTGQVHVAPGHGKDDYIAGQQNGLPTLSPVDDYGKFTEDVGIPQWVGKYVFDANAAIVEFLREQGSLLGEQKYTHDYPYCWRSKTPIVFRSVEQFFIRIDAFRAAALSAIDGVQWIPEWGKARIYGTVESRPDWCISRQRTWGVPLPVFYDTAGKPMVDAAVARKVADVVEQHGTNLWFEKSDAEWAQLLGLPAGTTRRNDTLDVWIDSGVSHTAVVAKHPALGGRPVSDVYIEATDQHRGWFQSSLMTSVALYGQAPYKCVITHGFVVDKDTRKKVSKSEQGTYAKPMNAEHFVQKYGADIVRLWASSVEFTNEVPFSEESFAGLTDAYRQFRNILRILLANASGFGTGLDLAGATTIDRWMLSRLQTVVATCREAYAAYDFRRVFQTLNQFVTVDVSALYVDITKDRLYCDAATSPRRVATQGVMQTLVDTLCRLLAPILCFTADEAWEFSGAASSVHVELFPEVVEALRNPDAEARVNTWLGWRSQVGQAAESARKDKAIGKALEAKITLAVQYGTQVRGYPELEEFFIVSEVDLTDGPYLQPHVTLTQSEHASCARCWRHRASVGFITAYPDLCDRCAEVVAAQKAVAP
jgi:isoleucyl-tRNA synthetase